MSDMPRPRKPYVHKEINRHNKVVWYFRRGKGKRIRLPGAFGSKEFNEAYEAALTGTRPAPRSTAAHTSVRWLVDRYYESGRFDNLRPNTQRNQRLELERVCKTAADLNFTKVTTDDLRAGIMRREKTPHMVNEYIKAMRALFRFAKDSMWIGVDPAEELKAKHVRSDGFHTWTMEEVERYQERHPIGTQARLALDLMLYTGLRRSDAIVLGRQNVRDGKITIRTGKTGAEVVIPVLPPLRASIDATKTGDLVFLVNTRGRPWKNISFGAWFADRCNEAGVPGRAHGLRKAGATIAANNGATPFELTAMYGWSSTKIAEVYTRKADKARLAERAANKLYPHPTLGAGEPGEKPLKLQPSKRPR